MTIKEIIHKVILVPLADFIADKMTVTASRTIKEIKNNDVFTAAAGKAQEIFRHQRRDPNSVTNIAACAIKSTALTVAHQINNKDSETRRTVKSATRFATGLVTGLVAIIAQKSETSPRPGR